MRLVTFSTGGKVQFGIRDGDLIRVCGSASSIVGLAMDRDAHPTTAEVRAADVLLLAPVPDPGKIVCIGLNYRAHAEEGGNAIPDYPSVFLRGRTSISGPADGILLPACSDKLDYEAELAVVIGRAATNVTSNPLDYVAGYCCFNDATVRDYQRKTSQWTVGKNFDRTGAFSSDLVTPDELPPGASGLRIESRLNGQVMQQSSTADMIFDVADLILTLSEAMTLEAGDIIATGTPSGVGYARKPPVFMRDGDRIEVEIERIGVASNVVTSREARK